MEQELICTCPECGSNDVKFCNISVRPYCHECNYWSPINFGTKQDAIRIWNKKLQKDRRIVIDLDRYVKNVLKKYDMYDEETLELALSDLDQYSFFESNDLENKIENILIQEQLIRIQKKSC